MNRSTRQSCRQGFLPFLMIWLVSLLVLLQAATAQTPNSTATMANPALAALLPGRWHGFHTVDAVVYHQRIDVRRQGDGFVGEGLAWFAMTEAQAEAVADGKDSVLPQTLDCATCIRLHYQVELRGSTLTLRCDEAQPLYQAWITAARDPVKRAGYRMPIVTIPSYMPSNALAEAVMRWPSQNSYQPGSFSGTLIAPGLIGGRSEGGSTGRGLFRFWKQEALSRPLPLRLNRGHVYAMNCVAGSAYHYTCYLPHSYNPARPTPVLLYMASHGNAKPLSTVMAERLGWIMVGFTEAQDGPWAPVCEDRDVVLFDLQRRFNIAPHDVYFAGFSGGARASLLAAVSYPDACAGVLCIGAGTPGENRMPILSIPVYFSAGETDYNRREVTELYQKERARGRITVLRIHSGGHFYGRAADHIAALSWLAANK